MTDPLTEPAKEFILNGNDVAKGPMDHVIELITKLSKANFYGKLELNFGAGVIQTALISQHLKITQPKKQEAQ